jgi:hypothetical protein
MAELAFGGDVSRNALGEVEQQKLTLGYDEGRGEAAAKSLPPKSTSVREKGGKMVEVGSGLCMASSPHVGGRRGEGSKVEQESVRRLPAMCTQGENPVP